MVKLKNLAGQAWGGVVMAGYETISDIKTFWFSQVNNLKAPHGKCNDSVELDFYASYTMSTCYMDCKQRYVISRCLCRDVYMAPDPLHG